MSLYRNCNAWLVAGLMGTGIAGLAPAQAAEPACPAAADITPPMLVGSWRIDWTDGARQRGELPWVLELAPHPEYADSLKGSLSRGAERHLVVADWDDEGLTLEESVDGQRIDATWQATAAEGQCGREFRGIRFTGSAPEASSARRFRMRRLP
jgi:hypothetical protein